MKKFLKALYSDFRHSLGFICGVICIYLLFSLPVLFFGQETAAYYTLLLMTVILPAAVFITSVIFGGIKKFAFTYLLSVPIFFIPVSILILGDFSFVYSLIFLVYALAGCGFGNLYRILRLKFK